MLYMLASCYQKDCKLAQLQQQTNPLFTHCRTVRCNWIFPPSLLTSGLNRTPVHAVASIKQCLIQKITAGSHWVELIWY